jgi:hypothetical protein
MTRFRAPLKLSHRKPKTSPAALEIRPAIPEKKPTI